MARQVRVILTDDIDGSEGAKTIEFSLAGKTYSIDLADANARKLEAALAPFIAKADKVTRPRISRGTPRVRSGKAVEMRDWARANGYAINERGRVPAHIVAAFEAAH